MIQELIEQGIIVVNEDGTFRFTEAGRQLAIEIFTDRPDLYAEVFKERLN